MELHFFLGALKGWTARGALIVLERVTLQGAGMP